MPERPEKLQAEELTLILRNLARGRSDAGSELMPFLLGELEAIARGYLRSPTPGQSLQPSALVNEAYLKLFSKGGLEFNDRAHFFAIAAKAMRQVLVSHARKRGVRPAQDSGARLSLLGPAAPGGEVDVDVLDLHTALEELTAVDERQGAVVELRFFGGLEVADVAEVLGVSKTTVEREWRFARAWLASRMRRSRES